MGSWRGARRRARDVLSPRQPKLSRRLKATCTVVAAGVAGSGLLAASSPMMGPSRTSSASGLDYRYVYISVPSLHGRATAMSDNDVVVGMYIENSTLEKGFVYDQQHGTTTLPVDPNMPEYAASAISRDGKTIAGWEETSAGDCYAVRWTQPSAGTWSIQQLAHWSQNPDANVVGCAYFPVAVGNDGSVLISTSSESPISGLLWNGSLSSVPAQVRALSSTGVIAGFTGKLNAVSPWTSTDGTLALPQGETSLEADGIARDGTLALNSAPPGVAYERTPAGTYVWLNALPVTGTNPMAQVRAISDHDEIVGDSVVGVDSGGVALPHAVRWNDDGSVVDLNDVTDHTAGETLLTARAVNKNGDIAGGAASNLSGGQETPFLLVAMPPIIFVPGVAGSHLVDPNGNEEWINCLGDHRPLALPPDLSTDIYADDVLRYDNCAGVYRTNDTDAYGPFIDTLERNGLVEYNEDHWPIRWTAAGCDTSQLPQHPNLFLFPYDWRMPNETTAQKLGDFMGCVRKFYTGPVMIVAHSMGGLVSRRYILDHPGDSHHVRDLVTIGTPWLGAPKLVNALETGEFIPNLMFDSTVKKVVSTMPGPGELMPSSPYYDMTGAPAPMREQGWDINDDGTGDDPAVPEEYSHAQVNALLDSQYSNYAPISSGADAFHAFTTAEGSQDDWRTDNTDVNYTVLYGRHALTDTPGHVTATTRASCWIDSIAATCSPQHTFTLQVVDGDGTVPEVSSARRGGGIDLNNTDHETIIPVYGFTYGDDTTEHTGLTRNTLVQQTVLQKDNRLLPGMAPASAQIADPSQSSASAWYVDAAGLQGTTTVTAPDGSNDALHDGIRPPLAGVSHLSQGDTSELEVLPDSGTYSLTFVAGSAGVNLDVRRGSQSSPSSRSLWLDSHIPAGRTATLTLADAGPSLRYDSDGDGAVDTALPATVTPSGVNLYDLDPPTITVGATQVQGTKEYTVVARDSFTGVRDTMWSIDGVHFQPYTGPIALGSGVSTLMAFADDVAGNRSPVMTFGLGSLTTAPVTVATVTPAAPSSGWSTTSETVTLHAFPSDGTTVKSITYEGVGPTWQTVVQGDSATIPLTQSGQYGITYWATDDQGHNEPYHVLRLGVDSSPPTVALSAPTTGTTLSALTTVTGNAKDVGSGVGTVQVGLQRNSDGAMWDGSAWQPGAAWLATKPATDWWTGNWVLAGTLPTGSNFPAGPYTVIARATDVAGNVATAQAAIILSTTPAIHALEAPAGSYAGHSTWAHAINNAGQIAGGVRAVEQYSTSYGSQAVRWSPDGTATLLADSYGGSCFGFCSISPGAEAWAINGNNVVAGNTTLQAADWLADGTLVKLPPQPSSGYNSTGYTARAINGNGVIAGTGYATWVKWTNGVLSTLPYPPGLSSSTGVFATIGGMNDAGTIVATVTMSSKPAAFVVSGGTASYMFPPPAGGSAPVSGADGINQAGDIVGWGGVDHAPGSAGATINPPFLRKADGTTTWFDLGSINQSCGMATAVNRDDVIVGYGGSCAWPSQDLTESNSRAWFIQDGKVHDLTSMLPADSGWVLEQATGINDAGQIVGVGRLNGNERGFVLSLGALPPPDRAPVASDVSATTTPGHAVTVNLQGTDPDQDALTWTVESQPQHGTLSPLSGASLTYTPADGFTGTDSFSVRASDGTYWSNTATVSIAVSAPSASTPVAIIFAPADAAEGTPFVVDGSASFAPDAQPLSYSWDLDGDGSFGDATGVRATITVPDNGTRTVRLRVSDSSGSADTSQTITIVNVAPVVSGLSDARVGAGQQYSARATFADPGADTWTATVDYGDGGGPENVAVAGSSVALAHTYATVGSYTVTLTVCDDDRGCGQDQASVDVSAASISVTGMDVKAVEGAAYDGVVATVTAPGTSPADLDAVVDWGDGTGPQSATVVARADGSLAVTGRHTYADEGAYTLGVVVSQAGASPASATSHAQVADAPLTAGPATQISAVEGSVLTGPIATFTDANAQAPVSDFTATVAWGDGATSTGTVSKSADGSFSVSATHTYAEEGSHTLGVHVVDAGGSTVDLAPVVTVADAPLDASGNTGLLSTASVSNLTVATFTDADPAGTAGDYSATIDWGDGSGPTPATIGTGSGGTFTVIGSHTYTSLGWKDLDVTVTDEGGSRTTTFSQLLVYAAPSGGQFVLGDRSAAVGSDVTFWGYGWATANKLSRGAAPADFKGFENGSASPSCGGTWASAPGNSSAPPSAVPSYMAVVVSSRVTTNGSVVSGDVTHIVIVRTYDGYGPAPGTPGTGTVVATLC